MRTNVISASAWSGPVKGRSSCTWTWRHSNAGSGPPSPRLRRGLAGALRTEADGAKPPDLLVPESDDRIHCHRAPRRHVAGHERDEGQEQCDPGEADRIGRGDVEQHGLDALSRCGGADDAKADADDGELHP